MARTRKPLQIPEGFSLEEITALAEQQMREKRNQWNREHPETIKRQRIRTYANYLRKNGLFVMNAELPALPWNKDQERMIINAIRANVEGLRNE